jgi:hypothetical protein
MTHEQAVRTVVGLVPDIEKRGAAEVLLEHARREDVTPAQLEKLAQVYNTLRTVSHIDNADISERGTRVPLVDVPELVVGYATGLDTEKAAMAPRARPTHDARTVDLRHALRSDALCGPAPHGIEKAASASPAELWDEMTEEDAVNAVVELEWDLREEMSKHAAAVMANSPRGEDGEIDLAPAERDALHLQPRQAVAQARAWLQKYAGANRLELAATTAVGIRPRAFPVRTAAGDAMAALAEAIGMRDVIVKMAVSTASVAGNDSSPDIRDLLSGMREAKHEREASSGGGGVATAEAEEEEGERDISTLMEEARDQGLTSGTGSGGGTPTDYDSGGGGGGGGGGGDVATARSAPPSAPPAAKEDGGASVAAVLAALTAPVTAAGEVVGDAASRSVEALNSVLGADRTNKRQMSVDTSVEDIRRTINLRRMIGTDPVLKEADPREVLEIYNSIVRLHPEAADDMSSLRLLLREAVSYEGLTLDAQKQLSEISRNSAQGEALMADNEAKRYATSAPKMLPNVNAKSKD